MKLFEGGLVDVIKFRVCPTLPFAIRFISINVYCIWIRLILIEISVGNTVKRLIMVPPESWCVDKSISKAVMEIRRNISRSTCINLVSLDLHQRRWMSAMSNPDFHFIPSMEGCLIRILSSYQIIIRVKIVKHQGSWSLFTCCMSSRAGIEAMLKNAIGKSNLIFTSIIWIITR